MTATSIKRRPARSEGVAEWRRWIRFADGTIVDPTSCPERRHNRGHWARTSDAADAPNSVCAHQLAAPAPATGAGDGTGPGSAARTGATPTDQGEPA